MRGRQEPYQAEAIMKSAKTTADRTGNWQVRVELPGTGPMRLQVTGKNTVTFRNVIAGDVWVCSGQSNMGMTMSWGVDNRQAEIEAADFPKIRLFTVKRTVAAEPTPILTGQWAECKPETVANFSAVAYFFGRHLHSELDVPIGLINTSWGGTPVESWMRAELLADDPDYESIRGRRAYYERSHPAAVKRYEEDLKKWEAGGRQGRRPRKPAEPQDNPWNPSGLYNGMIHPIIPFGIKGAIWYQGESNAGRAYQYRKLFPATIEDWRAQWGQGDFPFLFVQLANYHKLQQNPSEPQSWPELREAQTRALALPNTGMAVIIDIGEAADIHPGNKQDVGRRLGLAAQAIAYGQDIVYSGPMFDKVEFRGSKAAITFHHTGGGLTARDVELDDFVEQDGSNVPTKVPLKGKLGGFAVAGVDKKFVWAKATIEADKVVAWSDEVPEPVAIRYGWADNPACNLYNKEGLPASPFRTDDWPGVTIGKN
jgi:sialate O-acetylesterase